MNQILAKRYAFCNFSSIVGFPNPVPSRDEWENSLPRFRGEEWEVPAEHLLDFHDFIDRLEIVHEDVQIKLFKFSLEGLLLTGVSLFQVQVSALWLIFMLLSMCFVKIIFQLIFSTLSVVMNFIC
jgi:hypothetical protein